MAGLGAKITLYLQTNWNDDGGSKCVSISSNVVNSYPVVTIESDIAAQLDYVLQNAGLAKDKKRHFIIFSFIPS